MKLKWECVAEDQDSITERLKVYGGWLIRMSSLNSDTENMIYIKDEFHSWEIKS